MSKESKVMFSSSPIGFYPKDWIDDGGYIDPPESMIELTNDEVIEFRDGFAPDGMVLGSVGGRPAWVDAK